MEYDPIKRRLGNVFNRTPFLRKLFYALLDLLLLRAWHVRKELRLLKKRTFSGKIRILDAGSGFGQHSYRMSRIFSGSVIKGVDVKQEQIDDCNLFFTSNGDQDRVKFEYGDLTIFNEPYNYDLILSVDVMEHIEEDELVFSNFYKSLRKNGVLLISTPSDQGGSDTHDHEGGSVHGFIEEHVRDGYGIRDITRKTESSRFFGSGSKIYLWSTRIAFMEVFDEISDSFAELIQSFFYCVTLLLPDYLPVLSCAQLDGCSFQASNRNRIAC